MSKDFQISYDSDELIRSLEKEIDKLNVFKYDSRYTRLFGEHLVDRIGYWSDTVRKQKDDPLTIVVCGEFKRGKSSFINALLGDDIVTTNVTPETITVNRISYGTHSNEMVLSGGRRVQLADEDLYCENLSPILEKFNESSYKLELKRPIDILKGITIIDTPGLEDATRDYIKEVSEAISQADVIIFVFSVDSPISMTERFFLRNVVCKQKMSDFFVIANRGDIIRNTDDINKILSACEKRLGDLLAGESPVLVSSLNERSRQLGEDIGDSEVTRILNDNFDKLRASFTELVTEKRDCIIPDRIERMIRSMNDDLRASVANLNEGLNLSEEEAADSKLRIEKEKSNLISKQKELNGHIERLNDEFRANALVWIDAFISEMEKDADSISDYPAEDIQKYYSLFCIDSIQNAVTRCSEYYMESLFTELDKVSDGISKNISVNHAVNIPRFNVSFGTKIWTTADTISFAAQSFPVVNVLSSLPIISLAVDYAAGSARQRQMQKNIPNFKADIKSKYPQLKKSAIAALNKTYAALKKGMQEELDMFWNDRSGELETKHEQAALAARRDDAEKENMRQALNELEAVLSSIEKRFEFGE